MSPKDVLDRKLEQIKARDQWTIEQLARHLNCPPERIRKLVRNDTIKSHRQGNEVVIPGDSLSIDIIQTEELRRLVLQNSSESDFSTSRSIESNPSSTKSDQTSGWFSTDVYLATAIAFLLALVIVYFFLA